MRDPRVYGSQVRTWYNAMPFSKTLLGIPYSVLAQSIDDVEKTNKLSKGRTRVNILEKLHQNPKKSP